MNEDKFLNSKDADIEKATKIMKQYLQLKRQNAGCLLFFRIGDFYETFFEDALTFSKNCDVTLTKRKYGELGEVLLAGVPAGSFKVYLKKLLDKNIRVARAEQFKEANGEYARKITRIYTKGTVYEGEYLESDKNNYLCAVFKSNNRYGLSYSDVSEGELYLTAGSKEEIRRELIKISPDEILLSTQELIFEFTDEIPDKKSAILCPGYFGENKIKVEEGDYKEGLICANALLNYLFEMQKNEMPKLDNIKKYSISEFMSMDLNTRRALELTRRQADFKKHGTLFWFLDNTKTPMGKRLLKKWMNSPLYDIDKILKRQHLVKELCAKPDLRAQTEDFLSDFCDLLRMSSKISNKTISFKELLAAGSALSNVLKIKEIANELQGTKLDTDEENLGLLFDFSNIIERTFEKDSDFKEYESIPVKSGVNGRLDLLRDEFSQLKNEITRLENLQKNINQKVKTGFNPNIGYYFEVPVSSFSAIKPECVVKQKLSSSIRYTTEELLALEDKICSIRFSISELEKDIFNKLCEYSKELVSKIRLFARTVAYLDAAFSLSLCAIENNFCAPVFNKNGAYNVIEGAHPCVKKLTGSYIPNDTDLKPEGVFFNILTGANMSGKSTYLKQNALIAVLAQMGGFVPAKSANIALSDRIFLHSLIFDNLSKGASTFLSEIKNIVFILNNATKNSLILLDEPVRATNKNDSVCLLFAICEHIIEILKVNTIVVTHFSSVAKIKEKYSCAEAVYIDCDSRKINKGISTNSGAYDVAASAGLDKNIIERAKKYSGI